MKIPIKTYPVLNPVLKKLINFYWVIDCYHNKINHKLLPVRNIDMIINLSTGSNYETSQSEHLTLSWIYFHGLSDKHNFNLVKEEGHLKILGISFSHFGFFPLFGIPISEYKNQLIHVELIKKQFAEDLISELQDTTDIKSQLIIIEKYLSDLISYAKMPDENLSKMFQHFHKLWNYKSLEEFCKSIGIGKRTLERNFNKYVGMNPKSFLKLNRFQNTVNQISSDNYNSISDLVYSNGYFDQNHFNKDFSKFTGMTPLNYIKTKPSLKDISYFI